MAKGIVRLIGLAAARKAIRNLPADIERLIAIAMGAKRRRARIRGRPLMTTEATVNDVRTIHVPSCQSFHAISLLWKWTFHPSTGYLFSNEAFSVHAAVSHAGSSDAIGRAADAMKLCRDCKHYDGDRFCSRDTSVDLVTGGQAGLLHARTERSFISEGCGREGRFFEAKPPSPWQRLVARLKR